VAEKPPPPPPPPANGPGYAPVPPEFPCGGLTGGVFPAPPAAHKYPVLPPPDPPVFPAPAVGEAKCPASTSTSCSCISST
jgi:hypothetical protein